MTHPPRPHGSILVARPRSGPPWRGWLLAWAFCVTLAIQAAAPAPSGPPATRVEVEVEEELYRHAPANNGAGPMWCAGSTCLVRVGDRVYASGLETLPDAKPLNNCRWVLWRRDARGWQRWYVDETGRTREPAPLVALGDAGVVLSANPTLNPPDREGGGPARPELLRFATGTSEVPAPERWLPRWKGEPRFTEHSYRSFAADPARGEFILFQNIDYTHAEWTFRDATGAWPAQGQLRWPWGSTYAKPQPVRVCYPNVLLRERAVHFCGVSDILEPNPAWRAFKKELTGREWDYDFRRLFYAWTPDVTREPFRDWIEIASRDATGGGISAADSWLTRDGAVFLIWTERALDERLRAKFFPDAKQSHSLRLAVVRDGRVVARRTLLESTETEPGPVASAARYHERADGRGVLILHVSEAGRSRNELLEIAADGTPGTRTPIPFAKAFGSFFTATPRAGNAPSDVVDLLGVQAGSNHTLSYARLRLR